MIIEVELYSKIREMYVHQNKSQRAIARELGISRNTVKKYCEGEHVPWVRQPYEREATVLTEEVQKFIMDCFGEDTNEPSKKQHHTARKIYLRLVKEKGFTGAESTIRKFVRDVKEPKKEAFVPLEFDPGEAAQIDWGVAWIYLKGRRTKINLFCYRLCNSADIFVQAFFRQNQESFLEGHIRSFMHSNGVPSRIIFDNARVAVKEGFGLYAKPQDTYKALASHYAFDLDFTGKNSGNEKGLVENLVGWFRRNFLVPVPRVDTIEELNAMFQEACLEYRDHRIQGRDQRVGEQFKIEQQYLNPLPAYVFDPSKSLSAKVGDDSLIRFEKNRYSVPVRLVGQGISLKAYGNHLVCYYKGEEVCRHTRSYGREKTFFELEHYLPLLEQKPRSVFNAKPVRQTIERELLEWGKSFPNGAKDTVKLLRFCIDYGVDRVLAIRDLLPRGITPTIDLVRSELEPKEVKPNSTIADIPVDMIDLTSYDSKYLAVRQ